MPELRDVLRSGDVREIWTDKLGFTPWTDPSFDGRNLELLGGEVVNDTPSITTVEMLGGEIMPAYTVVWSDGTNVFPADNTVLDHGDKIIGITIFPVTFVGETIEVATDGVVINPLWSWTDGPLYIDVAGALTNTAPVAPTAAYLMKFATASKPDTIAVDFDRAVILVEET